MSQLQHSMFYDVLFPSQNDQAGETPEDLALAKVLRFTAPRSATLSTTNLVIFDFETTGLDYENDRIIEIGGLKIVNGKMEDEFSTLIKPDIELPVEASKITGITPEMLADQPSIEEKLPEFLQFIEGCILVAHNADFDMSFLRNSARRLGYRLEWPSFCTLRLARLLLPDLESKNLDTLAAHYNLQFEARHRSIGDCKVTSAVLQSLLSNEGAHLTTWNDLQPFAIA